MLSPISSYTQDNGNMELKVGKRLTRLVTADTTRLRKPQRYRLKPSNVLIAYFSKVN